MKSICVYCGSADGSHPDFIAAARQTGILLASSGLRVVYGGGSTGLMGVVADSALEAGGEVIGIITESMNTPALAHSHLTCLEVVPLIHQRKARMYELSDGFIALPGGYGTLDELFETLTWSQIGIHTKPVGLLNVNGYYNDLLSMLDRAVEEKFLFPEHRRSLACADTPQALLEQMRRHQYPTEAAQRWMRQA